MTDFNIGRRRLLQAAALTGLYPIVLGNKAIAFTKIRKKPNIVFIMADDLGYADLGCYGTGTYSTPNIDTLANEGLKLEHGYANSCVCSPTRVALATGRYQGRLPCGLEEPIANNGDKVGLPPTHPTLASLLREQGYHTALVGKWHIGEPSKFGPLKSGYDRFFGIYSGATDYFEHRVDLLGVVQGELYDGHDTVDEPGYLTDLLGDRTVREMEAAVSDQRPFFISLHFTAPHWPWEGPDDKERASNINDPMDRDGGSLEIYASMIRSMDDNIGKVLGAIDKLGQKDNTIVIFTSDNGGERFSNTWPLVGYKGELLEGGLRVPILIRWPERIAAGSTSKQVMISMDFVPTLLGAIEAKPDPAYPSDGLNLLEILSGEKQPVDRKLFWRHKARNQAAVREGRWKYLAIDGREHLFNIIDDPRERADLKERFPEIYDRLKKEFYAWDQEMLPYPKDVYSEDVIGKYSDRY